MKITLDHDEIKLAIQQYMENEYNLSANIDNIKIDVYNNNCEITEVVTN